MGCGYVQYTYVYIYNSLYTAGGCYSMYELYASKIYKYDTVIMLLLLFAAQPGYKVKSEVEKQLDVWYIIYITLHPETLCS